MDENANLAHEIPAEMFCDSGAISNLRNWWFQLFKTGDFNIDKMPFLRSQIIH